jgi:predicted DCC family thiol-disulfide oxidoreductase YuxK
MDSTNMRSQASCTFTMVFDDRCSVVGRLAKLVKLWDRSQHFTIVGRTTAGGMYSPLISQLDSCPSSLLLVDDHNERWTGPDAVPIILKNLPFGKIAAVLYTLPGTMWLTQWTYRLVSRSRKRFA